MLGVLTQTRGPNVHDRSVDRHAFVVSSTVYCKSSSLLERTSLVDLLGGAGCVSCDGTVAVSPSNPDDVACAAQSLVGPSAPGCDGTFAQTTDTFVDDFFDRDEPLQGNNLIRGGKFDVLLHTSVPGQSQKFDGSSLLVLGILASAPKEDAPSS